MLKTACVKKQGNQKFTLKSLPSSPPLQGESGLANHPPSCHPQGVWQLRKGDKMRESGEKVQKAGELKASPVKFID